MTDHSQRPSSRASKEALGQAGDEWERCKLGSLCWAVMREVVPLGRAGSEAGEVECNEAAGLRVREHVVAGEVVIRQGCTTLRARPVLAQQSPLTDALPGMAACEAKPVGGREQKGRRVVVAKQIRQTVLRCFFSGERFHRPIRMVPPEPRGKRSSKLRRAEEGRTI